MPLAMSSTGFCPASRSRTRRSPQPKRTQPSGIGASRARCRMRTPGCSWARPVMPGSSRMCRTCCVSRPRFLIQNPENVTPEKPANLFTQQTVELFAERQGPEGSSRAIGWDTPSQNSSSGIHFSPHSIGHLGFSGCSLWIDLEAGVAVALLTNRTWPDRQNQLIREVRPAFHDAIREAL